MTQTNTTAAAAVVTAASVNRFFADVTPLVIESDLTAASGKSQLAIIAEQVSGKEGIIGLNATGAAVESILPSLKVGETVRLFISRKGPFLDVIGMARPREAANDA